MEFDNSAIHAYNLTIDAGFQRLQQQNEAAQIEAQLGDRLFSSFYHQPASTGLQFHRQEYESYPHLDIELGIDATQVDENWNTIQERKRSRGSLSLTKCSKCRSDKVKCLPRNRVWSFKCERCIKKGLPCSRGTKATRRSKDTAAKANPIPADKNGQSQVLAAGQVALTDWTSLLSHYQDLRIGMHKLQNLQNEIGDHFFNRRDFGACGSGVEHYRVDVDLVRTTLMKSALRLPQAHMSAAISALLSREEPFELEVQDQVCCPLCEGARAPKELTEQGQTHKKLQACRKRLQSHRSFLMHEHHSVRVESEEQRYEELTETFVDETLDVLAKFPDLSEYREKPSLRYKVITPLHQFDEMTYWNLAGSDFDDCLGRTQLHRLLDQMHPSDIDDDWILREVLRTRADEGQNTQDILGRSLLHVACQKDWERGVRLLLQEGASPGVTTVYGSLPLHYAAAQGSVSICKLLLQHENEFDIEAKDCAGKTPKHYAQLWGHRDVSGLLAGFLPK